MKNIFLAAGLLLCGPLFSQYYYHDIVGTAEFNRQLQAYIQYGVATVTALGTDERGMKATDFSEYQEMRENGKALKVSTINQLQKTIQYSLFDEKGRVTSTADSSGGLVSTTTYQYDDAGRVLQVKNTIIDPEGNIHQTEIHDWVYQPNGQPLRMWRIILTGENESAADSLEVRFVMDENGNTAEERTFRKNVETGYLYYYYDDRHRLLDVVRYNAKLKKLLPDLMFEYDNQDRVVQKITTVASPRMGNYLIWRYVYDERGLKTKEVLFNNDKQITGRIDYQYTFRK
jgi:antitoxin component YwqK of YwqJK toxin-antitoxin module